MTIPCATCNPLLPIYGNMGDIILALKNNQVAIVSGETGSGKTSQLPLICVEAGFGRNGKIGITQPRRIAATSIAAYVADQCKSPLGSFVGYKVRFNDRESRDTRIKFMTDGILLRELEHDRLLRGYDVVIIDEAHERSLNIDFLLGYMRTILAKRPNLRLIISSATIDTRLFSRAFHDAPVISVSGRMFPVDIRYKPADDPDDAGADEGADYVSAAVRAIERIVTSEQEGDVLVFMPTERDILEAKGLLDDRLEGRRCAVMPLFGRMPMADQQNIFKSSDKQKIVIATNIAETSITVPNIRYVVDTGLARIKRYDPGMRITRLPVEAISQASAQQRAGRSGRVTDGVCVRLYSEEDFLTRPAYTLPEIQRANLGQVILSMASLKLGKVEDFPFLEPPPSGAVSQGYASLLELGALDKEKNLTRLGSDMAAFPLDPPLSRMIVEARKERCLAEMLVISAGLCVTDMRVRPQEKKQEADALHARFTDPMSDFLFYVKLWDAAGGARRQSLTQLRKFCKSNFVSFTRMREWMDVHSQLLGILDTNEGIKTKTASFEQLHRCILAGLISTIAKKTKDNDYHVAKGRTAFLFPGSALYKKKPDWIVCAELVETSRLYARTAAVVDPAWCETLAGHLCKHSYSEPSFDPETGTVKAHEKVMLFGLAVVEKRTVAYGRINRKIANEIFIRDGLADGQLQTHHPFYHHNKELQEHLRQFEKKMRSSTISKGDEAIISFYQARLPGITSIHDLNALIKEKGSDSFLHMKVADLTGQDPHDSATLFPDSVKIGVRDFPLRYEFDPSSLHDGATVEVSASELSCINEAVFDWIVPGFIVQRVQYLLESLPKSLKKQLEPVPETSQEVSALLSFQGEDFLDSLCEAVEKKYGLCLDPGQLPIDDLPQHLSVKVMVKKDLLQHSLHSEDEGKTHNSNIAEWKHRTAPFERKNLQSWDFSDIQDKIKVIYAPKDFSVYGFPSLVSGENTVDLVVFTSRDQQTRHHAKGMKKLLELCLAKDLAWMENGLKFGKNLQTLCSLIAKPQDIKDSLIKIIKDRYLGTEDFNIHKKSDFERVRTKVKTGLGSESIKLVSTLETVFADYHELQSMIKKRITNCNISSYRETAVILKKELQKYMINFVDNMLNYDMLIQYKRYLSAHRYRIDRAFSDMPKYVLKYENLRPYIEKTDAILSKLPKFSHENQSLIFEFAMMVEELKISTFAQAEIKTLFPVSQKKVNEKWEEVKKAVL